MHERLHLQVTGRVQGVSFRAYTQLKARELGLAGWVRNLPDGRVEVLAQGPRDALEALASWCRVGPRSARVTDLQIAWDTVGDAIVGFEIRRD